MDNGTNDKVEKLLIRIQKHIDLENNIKELHAIIAGTIRFIALKYLHNREDAEDLVQDFWMDILRIADGYHYSKNARGYLVKVANNMAINRYKKLHKNMPISIEYVKFSKEYQDSDMFIQKPQDMANIINLEKYLDKLPSEQGKIVQITYFEGKTIREIASEIKMSKSEVHRQKQIGLQRLKELIEQDIEV